MDWNDVSVQELVENLREVDWGRPKSLGDFFSRFTSPLNSGNYTARLKANVSVEPNHVLHITHAGFRAKFHYYRCNYLILCLASYLAFFLRNPLALVGVLLVSLAVLSTNDSFAATLNDHLLRIVRRIHPSMALKIRARTVQPPSPLNGSRSRRPGHRIYILTLPRTVFIAVCLVLASLLLQLSSAWRTLLFGTLLGVGLPLVHASFRSPNLKAKLANAKDEFRTRWKTYQADMLAGGMGIGMGSPAKGIGVPVDYSR